MKTSILYNLKVKNDYVKIDF